MCGITGFWQDPTGDEITLRQRAICMADTLTHRGPDDSGIWCDPNAGGLPLVSAVWRSSICLPRGISQCIQQTAALL
jgi:asparagine synthetase B (glutamine-hydrolysing)